MINPDNNRFYWLDLQQDLFKTWCIRKIYGGLKNNHKHEVWLPFENKQAASKELAELEYIKRQRGYIYADIQEPEHYHLRPQTIDEVLRI
jgi:predicted DNA-binding WGR domain protein